MFSIPAPKAPEKMCFFIMHALKHWKTLDSFSPDWTQSLYCTMAVFEAVSRPRKYSTTIAVKIFRAVPGKKH